MAASKERDLLTKTLMRYWGYAEFRENQYEAIDSLMKRRDCFLMMATGAGKSLIYQLPAVAMVDSGVSAVSIVVSPLIALMEDQVNSLKLLGINACLLGSSSTLEIEQLAMSGAFTIIYCSPEKAVLWCHGFKQLKACRLVTCLAIDESHCVSEWGHDFRPEYRRLAEVRETIGYDVPCIALTASATLRVQDDILRSLHLRAPLVIRASLNRPNIKYIVHRRHTSTDVIRILVEYRKDQIRNHTQNTFLPYPTTLVYVNSKKLCESIATELVECKALSGISVAYYHASLPLKERTMVLEGFLRDEVQVVVCTTAFGLGINKPDIRLVIHYGLPLSMEGYYQQSGRAGRDFMQSQCVLLWNLQDVNNCHFLLSNSSGHTSNGTSSVEAKNQEEELEQQVKTVVRYAKGQDIRCRREFILNYFQEMYDYVGCGINCCDLCDAEYSRQMDSTTAHSQESLEDEINLNYEVFLLLHTMYLVLPVSYGMNLYVEILLGKHTKTLVEKIGTQYAYLPTFGKGLHRTSDWWKALISQLVDYDGYIHANKMKNAVRYTYVTYGITELGKQFLHGRNQVSGNFSTQGTVPSVTANSMHNIQGGNLYDMLARPPSATTVPTYPVSLPSSSSKNKKGLVYDPAIHTVELKLSKDFLKIHHAAQAVKEQRSSSGGTTNTSTATATQVPSSSNATSSGGLQRAPTISSKQSEPPFRQSVETSLLQKRNAYAQSCHLPPYYLCTTAELSDLIDYVSSAEESKSIDDFISSRFASVGELKQWKREFIEQAYAYVKEKTEEQSKLIEREKASQKAQADHNQSATIVKPSSSMLNSSGSGKSSHTAESTSSHVAVPVPSKPRLNVYIPSYCRPASACSNEEVTSDLPEQKNSAPSSPLQRSQSCPPSLSQDRTGEIKPPMDNAGLPEGRHGDSGSVAHLGGSPDLSSFLFDYIPPAKTARLSDDIDKAEEDMVKPTLLTSNCDANIAVEEVVVEKTVVKAKLKRPGIFQVGGLKLKNKTM